MWWTGVDDGWKGDVIGAGRGNAGIVGRCLGGADPGKGGGRGR